MNYPNYQKLSKRGCEFLGSEYPIICGAMSWVSERNLVSAISNAGGFGVIAASSMPPEILAAEIDATKALTDKPFGVNLILMHPKIDELINICVEKNISHIFFAGGVPKKEQIEAAKAKGAKVIAMPTTLAFAKRIIRSGADALIIEGMEAGGHIGPVSLSVLAQEILPHIHEVPVFVAGGLGRGDAIASYMLQGAAGAQMGTVFVCASESIAHESFKAAFIRANARDAGESVQVDPEFPVIPVRSLDNSAKIEFQKKQIEVIAKFRSGEMEKGEAQLAIEHYWAGALRRAVIDGDVENGSIMAGQSVAFVSGIRPAAEIIAEIAQQAEDFLLKNKN